MNGDMLFGSLSYHENKERKYKDDLESLYYVMLHLAGVRLPWKNENSMITAVYKSQIPLVRVSKILLLFI